MNKSVKQPQTEIKKGATVIHTTPNSIKIKTGYFGITSYANYRYRVDIIINHKQYIIGIFDNLPDAINARKVAELKKSEGCFDEWFKTKPHGNSPQFIEFWNKEFEMLNKNT